MTKNKRGFRGSRRRFHDCLPPLLLLLLPLPPPPPFPPLFLLLIVKSINSLSFQQASRWWRVRVLQENHHQGLSSFSQCNLSESIATTKKHHQVRVLQKKSNSSESIATTKKHDFYSQFNSTRNGGEREYCKKRSPRIVFIFYFFPVFKKPSVFISSATRLWPIPREQSRIHKVSLSFSTDIFTLHYITLHYITNTSLHYITLQ